MYNQTLAKLLAKEDITVQHGNYNTAWFDIQNRVLGLPIWKDMGKDVYDLLIGHEIGHALYTPFEGWHDSPEKLEGAPRSYINVIEDARIERFVQRDYPGLVGPFKRGYKGLVDMGTFFKGLDDVDWNQTKLIDKINIKAKLRNMVDVPFNTEEYDFFKRSMTTQTFEQVVQLCRDILAYTRENTPELLKQPPAPEPMEIPGLEELQNTLEQQPPMGHDDMDPVEEEDQEATASASSDSEDGDESDDCEETNNTSSESNDDDTPSSDEDSSPGLKDAGRGVEDESITDVSNRDAERELIDIESDGRQPEFLAEPNQAIIDQVVIPYKKLSESRKKLTLDQSQIEAIAHNMKEFKPYMKTARKSTNFAIKEFEMRKAAYQWQRSATSKSGSLDVNQVHKYKYDEDIFARVTQLANAKNHGMMMLIDFSGSMSSTLGQVIDQLLHLVIFCKAVNIPFDVYAFTTGNRIPEGLSRDGEIHMNDVYMTQLISSTLKKKEYTEALEGLFIRMKANNGRQQNYWDSNYDHSKHINEYDIAAKAEAYGSTPLNDCLVLAHKMIRKFRLQHNIEKMNLVVLSDGDSNRMQQYRDWDLLNSISRPNRHRFKSNLLVDKKLIKLGDHGRSATHELLQNISKRYNCQTIGFFVSDSSHDWRGKLWECGIHNHANLNKEYRKHKCVTLKNTVGFDEFYLVKGGNALDASDDAFDVESDASKARIRTAFKKFSASKKNNKTLLTNFGKAVA